MIVHIITNDVALSEDSYSMNNLKSCRGLHISVCIIDPNGDLQKGKKDGSFKIRAYDSDKYLVRMYNDGVDTSATVQPKNVMMPSLKVNKDNAFIDFPINGYGIEDVDDLIKSLTDITDLMETLKELRKEIES